MYLLIFCTLRKGHSFKDKEKDHDIVYWWTRICTKISLRKQDDDLILIFGVSFAHRQNLEYKLLFGYDWI